MKQPLKPGMLYVTVDLLILTVRSGTLQLLLSPRTEEPFRGCIALPGRFIAPDETAEAAARHLLEEMLPIPHPFLEQLYTFTEADRDPRGRVISTAYLVIVPAAELDAMPARSTPLQPWQVSLRDHRLVLTREGVPPLTDSSLAFDHARIIRTGLMRLRGKIDYTDISFRFLRNTGAFSLSELQAVFEAVLETTLDSSNFRRFILNRYEKSGRLRQSTQEERRGRGRPAVLYRMDL